jgi:hypothetical protein
MYAASETDPKLIEDVIKIYGAIDSLRYSEIALDRFVAQDMMELFKHL